MSGRRDRVWAFVAAVLVTAVATLFGAQSPASAAPPILAKAPTDLCDTARWRNPANFQSCTDKLKIDLGARVSCLDAPTPSSPDSGMAGWFASPPTSVTLSGPPQFNSDYGYAGYDFSTYDLKCASVVTHPDVEFETR